MTDTEIANLALVKLGVESITTLTEATEQARAINRFYATVRDGYLSSYPWIFATKRGVELTVEATGPDTEWDYQALLPADLLRLLKVHDNGAHLPYELKDNGRIMLDTNTNIFVDYVRDVKEADFPAYFITALSWMLAAEACLALTEDVSKLQVVANMSDFWDRKARHLDSTQQPGRMFRVNRFTRVRG